MKDKIKDILFRLSIFGMLFIVPIVNSCCEAEASNTQATTTKKVVIHDVEQVEIKGPALRFIFFKFHYDGHEYFCIPEGDNYMMHSPNCSCLKETKVESSSLFDSSSSLFNW